MRDEAPIPIEGGASAPITREAQAAALEAAHRRIRELEDAVKRRDEFVAVAAHELRNPVGAIGLQVEALILHAQKQGAELPPSVMQRAQALRRQIHRFVKRATTLLDVTGALANELTLHLERDDFSSIIQSACELYGPELEARRIALRLRLPRKRIDGMWDRDRLEAVAANLLSNAIKYGEGRPIDVTVKAGRRQVLLMVRDRGIGIAPEDQARIFEYFERGAARHQEGGFGVGLWLVRRIVDAMRGTVAIISRSGEGTRFVVRLPRS